MISSRKGTVQKMAPPNQASIPEGEQVRVGVQSDQRAQQFVSNVDSHNLSWVHQLPNGGHLRSAPRSRCCCSPAVRESTLRLLHTLA